MENSPQETQQSVITWITWGLCREVSHSACCYLVALGAEARVKLCGDPSVRGMLGSGDPSAREMLGIPWLHHTFVSELGFGC